MWWEAVPLRSKVIGYEVFYSMTAVEDLDQWQRKTVGLTTSIDLVNLERHAQVVNKECGGGIMECTQIMILGSFFEAQIYCSAFSAFITKTPGLPKTPKEF